jgi:uncharacterized protein YdeI (YjbR/CyaY-like superfamily)
MAPVFFKSQAHFRKWLEKNHKTAKELIVGFYKVSSGKQGLTYPQSVEEALCFGWIDGIKKSVDSESYSHRFTPRRPNSVWSNINIKKVEDLKVKGLMMPMGIEAFEKRKDSRSGIYSFENEMVKLDENLERIFKKNNEAWSFYLRQAPSYRKTASRWIMTARQEITKLNRLNKLIEASEKQKRAF